MEIRQVYKPVAVLYNGNNKFEVVNETNNSTHLSYESLGVGESWFEASTNTHKIQDWEQDW